MNNEFISIKDIISEVYDHPLMQDITEERIIRDSIELIKVTNSPNLFEQREALIHIDHHKGQLPCDYIDINQVILFEEMKEFHTHNKAQIVELKMLEDELNICEDAERILELNKKIQDLKHDMRTNMGHYMYKAYKKPNKIVFKPATSTFSPIHTSKHDLVYKLQGRIIITSLHQGDLLISYKALKLDDEGYPMIINNAEFQRALVSYIKKKWFTILFDQGKINGQVLQNVQQEYYLHIGQAQNSLLDFNEEKAMIIDRILNNPFIDDYEWNKTFDDLNKRREYRLH